MADATDATVKRWLDEISAAKKDPYESWVSRGKKIIDRYKDERPSTQTPDAAKFRMNILWSNVETLKPALYAQTPNPVVQRRNKDRDPVGRWASTVLERDLSYNVSMYDFDHVMRECVQDYLLPGKGVAWVSYKPKFEGEGEDEYVKEELVVCEHVHWKDFLTNAARSWSEVWWVGKRAFLTRKEIEKNPNFKKVKVSEIVLDHKPDEPVVDTSTEQFAKATVWEIWSKRDQKVYFIAPGYKKGPLGVIDPPIKFDGFFPCPRPLSTPTDGDSLTPIPDYAQYQDQAEEIDTLTQRIGVLSKALKAVGVYDATQTGIQRLLEDGTDNELVPVQNWALFGEKGGFKGTVDWLPIEAVAKALSACYEAREASKQILYEVTGIGDIIRGATDPNETATAQQIKSQWGSIRVRDRQKEVQRFARDLLRLKAEVIAEQFDEENIKTMSSVRLLTQQEKQLIGQAQQIQAQYQQVAQQAQQSGQQPPPPPQIPQIPEEMAKLVKEPTWEEVLGLLKNGDIRGFSIEVETDSTIQPDENAERENRVQLATALSQYMPVMGEAVTLVPESADMMGEILNFVVRGWRGGEQLEPTIEEFVETMKQKAKQPRPDPAAAEAQAKTETEKERLALDAKNAEEDRALKKYEIDGNMALKREEAEAHMTAEREKMIGEHGPNIIKSMQDMQQMQMEMQQQNAQMMQGVMQALGQISQTMAFVAQAVTAPKKAIRDPKTRELLGTETVMPQQPQMMQ